MNMITKSVESVIRYKYIILHFVYDLNVKSRMKKMADQHVTVFYIALEMYLIFSLQGRPLMIWGAEKILDKNLLFFAEAFLKKIPQKAFLNFSPREGLLFFFSSGRPFEFFFSIFSTPLIIHGCPLKLFVDVVLHISQLSKQEIVTYTL